MTTAGCRWGRRFGRAATIIAIAGVAACESEPSALGGAAALSITPAAGSNVTTNIPPITLVVGFEGVLVAAISDQQQGSFSTKNWQLLITFSSTPAAGENITIVPRGTNTGLASAATMDVEEHLTGHRSWHAVSGSIAVPRRVGSQVTLTFDGVQFEPQPGGSGNNAQGTFTLRGRITIDNINQKAPKADEVQLHGGCEPIVSRSTPSAQHRLIAPGGQLMNSLLESWLSELRESPLQLGDSVGSGALENLWTLAFPKEVTEAEILEFLLHAHGIRLSQVVAGEGPVVFYVWHDAQAGQIRFSTARGTTDVLPFGARVQLVTDLEEIVRSYLRFDHRDGVPLEELEETEFVDPADVAGNDVVRDWATAVT